VSEPEVMLRFDRMSRRYGAVTAVEELSFEVHRGEMFGIIGPDGAGKTTTLRVALGLIPPSAGVVETCGLNPRRQARALSARVGYLSQRFSLYGDLSVDENIGFFADIHGVRGWQGRRDELLEMVRMTPFRKRLAERLSGGMKQKLALACTLIHTPEMLVLDEPTTGVDPVSRRDFWKLLAGLQRSGLTIVMTTPYIDEAERCHRVALMDQGRLLALDTPEVLRSQRQGAMLEVLARPRGAAAEILREAAGVTEALVFGERVHVTLGGVPEAEADSAAVRLGTALRERGIEVEAVRPVTPSLEDIFVARVEAADAERRARKELTT